MINEVIFFTALSFSNLHCKQRNNQTPLDTVQNKSEIPPGALLLSPLRRCYLPLSCATEAVTGGLLFLM